MSETESNPGEVVIEVGETLAYSMVEEASVEPEPRQNPYAFFFAIAGWIVPGLGHLLLRRWGRACVLFGAVSGLAMAGLLLKGSVFPPHSEDPFGTLGFLADAGSGIFYYFAHFIEANGADLSRGW